jgi:4-methylaminobutanoate oxidase (formaldehyde-forming)
VSRIPDQARVVVIGGGIVGCSVAYHLAKFGCKDVVLLEKHRLTSGSTWHAAGAVGQLRANANITRLLGHSVALYHELEAETGQATGWTMNGSLRLACNRDRIVEYERAATTARSFGLAMEILAPAEAKAMIPAMNVDDVLAAAWLPSDGVANPSDLTMGLAKGAHRRGATLVEGVRVTGFRLARGRIEAVLTAEGAIRCESAVICAGIWSREIAKLAGANVPIQPSHHQYIVTEPLPDLPRGCPAVRDPDHLTYFKEEVGGLAAGGYETNPIPYRVTPIPEDHEFKLMPENVEQFEVLMRPAVKRFPALERAGIKRWFNGIESFTEDGMFILGETPEVGGLFVGCGFNSFGIAAAGGAGKALAEWVLAGEQPFDLWAADIRRFGAYHRSDSQVCQRALEGQGHHYLMGWPYEEPSAGRPFRRSPLYDRLMAKGCCFGTKAGWERPNWFAPEGVEPRDVHSFGRQNWFPHVAAEHRATREAVALFDQSFFAKFSVVGADAEAVLQRICAGDVGRAPGRITYTQMLNAAGGIECDLSVSRLSETEYYIVTGTGFATHDFAHIRRHVPEDARVALADVTSAFGCLALMGPRSREVLAAVAEGDLSNAAFPFGACREIAVAGAPVRALRITFVGELGWELHIPTEYVAHVYDALVSAGAPFGLRDAGYRAIDSLRLEKGYRVWAGDIGPDFTPFEAGLGFAVALDKNADFIGREALLARRGKPLDKRLATFTVDDPETVLLGRETIYRNGERVGWIATAGHGHTVAKDIGLGYVRNEAGVSEDWLLAGRYELEVRTRRVPAAIHLKPLYDPSGARIRA